jgi:hypothetical protein
MRVPSVGERIESWGETFRELPVLGGARMLRGARIAAERLLLERLIDDVAGTLGRMPPHRRPLPPSVTETFEWLPTRMQLARILARCAEACTHERRAILRALECVRDTLAASCGERVPAPAFEPIDATVDEELLASIDIVFEALGHVLEEAGRRDQTRRPPPALALVAH